MVLLLNKHFDGGIEFLSSLHCKSGDSVFIYLSPCIVLLNLRERIFEISSFEEVFLI